MDKRFQPGYACNAPILKALAARRPRKTLMYRTAIVAWALLTANGCFLVSESSSNLQAGTSCANDYRDLLPGELVDGSDPATLLSRYEGTWSGSLEWIVGGQAGLTVTIPAPDPPLHLAEDCSGPTAVYGYATASLLSDDGALNATPIVELDVQFYGTSPKWLIPSFSGTYASQMDAARSPVDLARYNNANIIPSIVWDEALVRPLRGSLSISAQAKGVTVEDEVLIATLSF